MTNLTLKYLSGYAAFLLKNKLNDYVNEVFKYLHEEKIPLLKIFKNHSKEELLNVLNTLSQDLLSALANNRVEEYIQNSTIRYVDKLMPFFEREAVVAEDITSVSFIRRKILRKFLSTYTTDSQRYEHLVEEIDRFTTASELSSFNAYIKTKQERINKINTALAQRQEELLEAEELAGMGSFFWDLKDNIKRTPGLEKILGMPETGGLDAFLQNVHQQDRSTLEREVERALSGDGNFECEYRYYRDGREKNIRSRGVVNFQNGKPVSLKGTVMDFTVKYRLIKQLQESEALNKQAQALTHIGNWTWEIGENKVIWSDEMYRIYGLEPQSEEITFERFASFIHPEGRDKRIREIQESLQTLSVRDYLMRIINPDGTEKVLKGKGEVIVDDNKVPVKLVGTCQDITTEHNLNKALQEQEEYQRQLIENAPDAVIVTDTNSTITLWNIKAEEIFGWTAAEALGKSLNETIIPPQHREAHNKGIQRLLKTGIPKILNKPIELTALNKNGEEFLVSLTISQLVQQGKLSFIAFLRNISDEKRTKTELVRINKELESFNYVVSHDLQEPLRKIQIFSNRIIEKGHGNLPSWTVGYLDKIISSSERMKRLIEDLLTFSQTTTNDDNFQMVDLNSILEEVENILAAIIEERKVMIKSEPLPVLWGLPFQLQQLFLNIISNAIKYSRDNVTPQIKISSEVIKGKDISALDSATRPGNYHKIKIEDNGIGFKPDYAEKVFQIFQRLHHKNEYSGTGIGLAICKKIVDNHNGFISAEGFPGKGSVFYIYLRENVK